MEAATPAPEPAAAAYPVRLDAERQVAYNRGLPLVKWLLALPHYIVLALLSIAALVVVVISFFAVIITGRYPRGMWDFLIGFERWAVRVGAYVLLLTDRYPPFALADDPSYPVRLDVDYPETIDRWRPLVQWLLVLPFAIVAGILYYVAVAVAFIGVFVILFTKNLPQGMFNLILVPMRWQARSNIYGFWQVKRYPPFNWEE